MNGISLALTIIGSVMTFLSVTVAIFTFLFNRKKENNDDGEFRGSMKSDIRHIKEGVDELKANTAQINTKVSSLEIEIHDVRKSVEAAHERIDGIEARKRKEEV